MVLDTACCRSQERISESRNWGRRHVNNCRILWPTYSSQHHTRVMHNYKKHATARPEREPSLDVASQSFSRRRNTSWGELLDISDDEPDTSNKLHSIHQ